MNSEFFPTLCICGIITILVVTICKIFIKGVIFIAKTIVEKEATVDFKLDLILIAICTLTICLYFLI